MSDSAKMQEYLARGGKLTSPENAPPRYRAELMRQMASFVDSELAGAAGFADCINFGPGIKERIAASRIVLEKHDHAERVLTLMGEFGANTDRYERVHPWHARAAREDDFAGARQDGDMRLNVFHYPIDGWVDAVVMNVLMGAATVAQITELSGSSYQPFAAAMGDILPREQRHLDLGVEGLRKIAAAEAGRDAIAASREYWRPRVAASFGGSGSDRVGALLQMGLRKTPNETLRAAWADDVDALFHDAAATA